jgi:transcriptional antiterminator RfaH
MSYWACAQLQPQRERLALHCLERVAGFTTYCPRIRPRACPRKTLSLFPGYAFIVVVNGWYSARWTPGVVRIVLDDGVPARVPDAVIDAIRARERDGVVILPEQQLRHGDRVRITRGPFCEQLALYAGQAPHERIAILLSLFGRQSRIVLGREDVEAM